MFYGKIYSAWRACVPIQLQRNSLAVQRSRVGQMRVAKSKRVRLLRQLAVTEPIHRDRRCLTLT